MSTFTPTNDRSQAALQVPPVQQTPPTGPASAILFDLFGTLVAPFAADAFALTLRHMAEALGAPAPAFTAAWLAAEDLGMKGAMGSLPCHIERICADIGVSAAPEQVAAAASLHRALTRETLAPRAEAEMTLAAVRAAGLRVGLLTNCGLDVPDLWADTRLAPLVDAAVFSCSEGLRKPDVRLYQAACARLATPPAQCIYVSDGGAADLEGATTADLRPILLDSGGAGLPGWTGVRVTALSEVVALVVR